VAQPDGQLDRPDRSEAEVVEQVVAEFEVLELVGADQEQ